MLPVSLPVWKRWKSRDSLQNSRLTGMGAASGTPVLHIGSYVGSGWRPVQTSVGKYSLSRGCKPTPMVTRGIHPGINACASEPVLDKVGRMDHWDSPSRRPPPGRTRMASVRTKIPRGCEFFRNRNALAVSRVGAFIQIASTAVEAIDYDRIGLFQGNDEDTRRRPPRN